MADLLKSKDRWLKIYGTIVGLYFLLPFLYILLRSFTTWEEERTRTSRAETVQEIIQTVGGPLLRSLLLALAVSITTAILGTLLAWITHCDIPLRKLLTTLLLLPLALPSFVGAAAVITSFSPGGGIMHSLLTTVGIATPRSIQGFWPAWLVLTFFTYPYVYLSTRARLLSLRPSLEESARLLGKSPFKAFTSVTLPQLKSAILSGSLIVFLYCLGEFGAVNFLQYETLTSVIYESRISNTLLAFTSSLCLALTAGLVVSLETRFKPTNNDSKAEHLTTARTQLGKWRIPAVSFVWSLLTVALLLPLSGLALWAWRGVTQANLAVESVITPLLSSTVAAIVAATVTMLIILPVALLTLYSKSTVARFSRATILASYATPGVIIALSFVLWTLNVPGFGWLYASFTLLLMAYVVHFGSLGLGAAETALKAVPHPLKESARLLTSSNVTRWRKVHLPLMKPGLLAGGGLVALATLKELPATLLLAPTGFSTISTEIWAAFRDGTYAKTGLLSIMLVLLSGTLTWLLVIKNLEE